MYRFVLLSSDSFPPTRVEVVQIFVRELAQRRGHRIDWILQAADPSSDRGALQWEGGEAWIAPTIAGETGLRLLGRHLMDLRNDLHLLRLLRLHRYDCVLFKDKFLSPSLALLLARRRGLPFLYWLSYPFPEASRERARHPTSRFRWFLRLRSPLFSYLLYRWILPRCTHAFVQSERMRDDIATHGIPTRKMTAVPMGVALDRMPYPFPTPTINKPDEERWLVYLGTLSSLRRPELLIRVLGRVRERAPDVVLYLVGRGDTEEDEQVLVQEAHRLGLSSEVRMIGHVDQELAWEYAALADVCLSPYPEAPILQSTSPTKLVEYLALGRPVVASLHPEQEEILMRSGAGLCVPLTVDDFSDAVVDLLERPAQAAEMGRSGRAWVEAHRNYETIADIVERTLNHVLSEN